jgi:hypothetical protein
MVPVNQIYRTHSYHCELLLRCAWESPKTLDFGQFFVAHVTIKIFLSDIQNKSYIGNTIATK